MTSATRSPGHSRRTFLAGMAAAGGALLWPPVRARATNYPIDAGAFPALADQRDRPWLSLATSLPEEHDYVARVEGRLPEALRGTLYRNGPGLFERDGRRKQCLLDGDGMLQAFAFAAGGVRYRNRFTRTAKFEGEERAGRYRHATWTTQAPGGFLANLMGRAIENQAGVSTAMKNGRLFAFDEAGRPDLGNPYELDPETLATRGPAELVARGEPGFFSAHPKTDAQTGEWLHFGLEYGRALTVHLTTLRADGTRSSHRALELPRYSYIHDWFVTEHYRILNLHPAEISLLPFLSGTSSLAGAFRWRPEQGNLLLVLPREGPGEPVLLEGDPVWMWHSLNAYEREGRIVADFVGYEDPSHFLGDDALFWTIMSGRAGRNAPGTLRRYVIDPVRRTLTSETLAEDGAYEFPVVDPRRSCHPHRYAHLVRRDTRDLFWREVARVDLETGSVDRHDFGEGVIVTEPIFAPDPEDAAPERGWLLTEGYDGHRQKSFLAVLRAERVADGPVAVVHLNHHVPFSFHGWWQPAADRLVA